MRDFDHFLRSHDRQFQNVGEYRQRRFAARVETEDQTFFWKVIKTGSTCITVEIGTKSQK